MAHSFSLLRAALMACLLLCSSFLTAAPHSHMGTHGMLLFGGEAGLVASHLPMYHVPHNAQVLLRLSLSDKTLDAKLRQTLDGYDGYWTLVPKPFDLMRLAPDHPEPLRRFQADLYQDHFERGGQRRYSSVWVEVELIERFALLSLEPAQPNRAVGHYCTLSIGDSQFLYKRLGQRPEADHFIRLDGAAGSPTGCLPVAVDDQGAASEASLRQVLLTGPDALAEPNSGVSFQALQLQTLYLETGELR